METVTIIVSYLNTFIGTPMTKIRIENVVATTSLCKELDLKSISKSLEGAQYDTERFPGLVYRMKNPKVTTLLFRNGKVVCTGAKSLEEVRTAIDQLVKQMEAAGVPVTRKPEIIVQNIVATAHLGCVINLSTIAHSLSLEKVEYEPEQFPGLVYRLDKPKVVALLFGSGKIVCTGARKTEDAELAVERITKELRDAGQLR
jgi:transcription initiation factor TFIID TATA-box-binding protein